MRILAVGNGMEVQPKVVALLRQNGLAVDICDKSDLVSLSRRHVFDMLMVYLSMNERRATDIIRALRRQGCTTPLLGVNLSGDPGERIEALNIGADDCVPATVPGEELLARIRALLRRPPVSTGPTYNFADLTLDASAVIVTCGRDRVSMPRREMALLEVLMRAGLSPVSRERLEHALFRFQDAVTPNALEAAISRLRRRLKAAGALATVTASRGFGYRLQALGAGGRALPSPAACSQSLPVSSTSPG